MYTFLLDYSIIFILNQLSSDSCSAYDYTVCVFAKLHHQGHEILVPSSKFFTFSCIWDDNFVVVAKWNVMWYSQCMCCMCFEAKDIHSKLLFALLQAAHLLFPYLMDSLHVPVDLDFSVQFLTCRLHLILTLVVLEATQTHLLMCKFCVSDILLHPLESIVCSLNSVAFRQDLVW